MKTNSINLVQVAFDDHERLMESQSNLVLAVNPNAFQEPVDEMLIAAVADFVCDAADACRFLVPRSRAARLKMRWRDFIAAAQKETSPPRSPDQED